MDPQKYSIGGSQYTEQYGKGSSSSAPASTNAGNAAGGSIAKPPAVRKLSKETKAAPAAAASTKTAEPLKEKKILPPKPPGQIKPSRASNENININRITGEAPTEEISELRAQISELKSEKAELKVETDRLEKERDFYFDKLRDIEMMLQDLEDNGEGNDLTANIFKILYATADGFEAATDVDEGGQPIAQHQDETY